MSINGCYIHTLSSITLSRFVPAIWKLVSLDDFNRSMKSLTLASYIQVRNSEEMHQHNYGDILHSLVRHFCRNLASTSSSNMLECPVPYMGQMHRLSMVTVEIIPYSKKTLARFFNLVN